MLVIKSVRLSSSSYLISSYPIAAYREMISSQRYDQSYALPCNEVQYNFLNIDTYLKNKFPLFHNPMIACISLDHD